MNKYLIIKKSWLGEPDLVPIDYLILAEIADSSGGISKLFVDVPGLAERLAVTEDMVEASVKRLLNRPASIRSGILVHKRRSEMNKYLIIKKSWLGEPDLVPIDYLILAEIADSSGGISKLFVDVPGLAERLAVTEDMVEASVKRLLNCHMLDGRFDEDEHEFKDLKLTPLSWE